MPAGEVTGLSVVPNPTSLTSPLYPWFLTLASPPPALYQKCGLSYPSAQRLLRLSRLPCTSVSWSRLALSLTASSRRHYLCAYVYIGRTIIGLLSSWNKRPQNRCQRGASSSRFPWCLFPFKHWCRTAHITWFHHHTLPTPHHAQLKPNSSQVHDNSRQAPDEVVARMVADLLFRICPDPVHGSLPGTSPHESSDVSLRHSFTSLTQIRMRRTSFCNSYSVKSTTTYAWS